MEILFLLIMLVIGIATYLFNQLVKSRNFVRDAWAGIEVQLTKRHDLIPLLVKTVKVYANYESSLLKTVATLRTPTISSNLETTRNNEQNVGDHFHKLFMLSEEYPDIKADQNFQRLQEQLIDVEEDIEHARRYYNGSVRDLNILIESFPSNIIANVFSFQQEDFFKLRLPTVKDVPRVIE